MYLYAYKNTERGIRERKVAQIVEEPAPKPVQPRSMFWVVNDVSQIERRRLEAIEAKRNEGLRRLRRNGMPEWAIAIVIEVADRHAICISDIASRKRNRPIIEARREAAYFVKAKSPGMSTVLLGKWFGKDHTSIAHLIACYQVVSGLPKLVGYTPRLSLVDALRSPDTPTPQDET